MGARRTFMSWRSGGSSRRACTGECNMKYTTCWLTVVLLMFFPASAIARIGPGPAHLSATSTISYPEQTPTWTSVISHGQQQETVHIAILGKKDKSTKFHGLLSRGRRRLVGSSPPTCVGRCGACVPCKPVHVVITSPHSPHPVISEADYYPEVWRCLCGNTYYMP